MKKIITLFTIILALVASSYAQVKVIAKAGATLTNVSFNKDINDQFPGDFKYGSKAGFIAGFAAEIPLGGSMFSLQPELLFHQKGYTSEYSDSEVSDSYTFTLNYLDVPVLAKVNFGKFYAGAGTYLALGLGGKYKGSDSYMGNTVQHDGKIKFGEQPDNYMGQKTYANAMDLGLQVGAGMKVSAVVIDLRFGLGLSDLYDQGDLDTHTRNRSFQLTVGVPIRAKK